MNEVNLTQVGIMVVICAIVAILVEVTKTNENSKAMGHQGSKQ